MQLLPPVTGHKWRPLQINLARGVAWAERPCAFSGCRRHRTEHSA